MLVTILMLTNKIGRYISINLSVDTIATGQFSRLNYNYNDELTSVNIIGTAGTIITVSELTEILNKQSLHYTSNSNFV